MKLIRLRSQLILDHSLLHLLPNLKSHVNLVVFDLVLHLDDLLIYIPLQFHVAILWN